MLHNLYVKNLALIDEIDVEFKNGLNILTGETGAGKSIILGSINLALGGRYSSDLLRNEEETGYVELTFSVDNPDLLEFLERENIFLEDDTLILSRKLMGRRSICKINGETVSNGTLKEVASYLIDIHGQHEHQSLLYKKNHLDILDTFAKEQITVVKQQVSDLYQMYKECKAEFTEAKAAEKDSAKEIGFIEYELQEIEAAQVKMGEDEELEQEYQRMLNGKKIAESLTETYGCTGMGSNNASDLLSRGIRALQDACHYDERVEELYSQLAEVDSLLNDFNRELADYSHSLEFSEEDFYETETRLNEINRLKSKYGNTISDILAYQEERTEKLNKLKDYDQYLMTLEKKLVQLEEQYQIAATMLSQLRKEAAYKLTGLIRDGLLDLNFLDVKFEIGFTKLLEFTKQGIDEVEFMISMNPGEPVKPLGEVASGGELSRIMLAIKTVLAEKDQIETLIFDEIDVGISGRTAQKVSEKMAVIGRNHQVICITHLAQIAAMADAHYAIEKDVYDGKTQTMIHLLNSQEEIGELARILGGAEITATTLQSAAEMKELAKRTK